MGISGNPKMMAYDIAKGLLNLSPNSLRQYGPGDLKIIKANLQIAQREIRAEQVPQEDALAIKAKNTKLSRINQAMMIVETYCKQRKILI